MRSTRRKTFRIWYAVPVTRRSLSPLTRQIARQIGSKHFHDLPVPSLLLLLLHSPAPTVGIVWCPTCAIRRRDDDNLCPLFRPVVLIIMNNSGILRNLGGVLLLVLLLPTRPHISAEYTVNELAVSSRNTQFVVPNERSRRGTEKVRSRQPFGRGFFGSETMKVEREERREARPMLRSSPTSPEPVKRKNGNIFAAVINTLLHKEEGVLSNSFKHDVFCVCGAWCTCISMRPTLLLFLPFSALVGPPTNVRVEATSNSTAVIQWDFESQKVGVVSWTRVSRQRSQGSRSPLTSRVTILLHSRAFFVFVVARTRTMSLWKTNWIREETEAVYSDN